LGKEKTGIGLGETGREGAECWETWSKRCQRSWIAKQKVTESQRLLRSIYAKRLVRGVEFWGLMWGVFEGGVGLGYCGVGERTSNGPSGGGGHL